MDPSLSYPPRLITPTVELPFTKVAKLASPEKDFAIPKGGVVSIKVRFTARPRAVFHKHSDVMILCASLIFRNEVIAADSVRLFFFFFPVFPLIIDDEFACCD